MKSDEELWGDDTTCSDDARLQHLKHFFLGYRAQMTNDEETQPFSPGSARDISWQMGVAQAKKDMAGSVIISGTEAKELLEDLVEVDRHFDLESFCETDDHAIGRFIDKLRED